MRADAARGSPCSRLLAAAFQACCALGWQPLEEGKLALPLLAAPPADRVTWCRGRPAARPARKPAAPAGHERKWRSRSSLRTSLVLARLGRVLRHPSAFLDIHFGPGIASLLSPISCSARPSSWASPPSRRPTESSGLLCSLHHRRQDARASGGLAAKWSPFRFHWFGFSPPP